MKGGVPADLQQLVPNATVTFSKQSRGDLGTTTTNSLRSPTPSFPQPSSTPSTSHSPPSPKPSTPDSFGLQIYAQSSGPQLQRPSDDFDQCVALAHRPSRAPPSPSPLL
ncbi:hypothetical protein AC1031_010913 [Aphanomyces cochlioides]|nr:hypothetical protein AC1031_010909 [Aphanomyces cochlioides]KAG9399993.1 hypothetical protein AC1031_010913 [Aphanomyces cochlioides]